MAAVMTSQRLPGRIKERLGRRLREDPRLARMLHGGASGLLVRGLGTIISLISLPLNVRYLGKLEYGIWITISSSVVMLNMLDLGIANTLTNFISEAYADNDREKAQGYFATAFWLTVGVSAALSMVFAVVWRLVDWGALLSVKDPVLAEQTSLCIGVAVLFLLVSLPLNLANRVLSGYQQVHVSNYFQMANNVMGLFAILLTMALHGTIVHLMVAFSLAMLTGSVALNVWLSGWHKPWIRARPGSFSAARARALFGQGALFFVLQLTGLVVFNSDNLVITHYLGPAEVTPYSIAWRLVSYASLFQVMLVPSFWPAFTEAYRKRELPWLRATYRSMGQKTLLVIGAGACAIGVIGRPVIRLWAGPAAVPPALLLWTMVLWALVSAATTHQAMLLTATSRLRLEAGVGVLAAIANLGLSIVLVKRIGAEGVILATILSFAILMFGPQQWEVRRVLRGIFLPAEVEAASLPALELVPALHEEMP